MAEQRFWESESDLQAQAPPEGARQTNGKDHGPMQSPDPASLGILLWHSIEGESQTDRLVKGLIGEQTFTVVAGATGSGKTFITLDMVIHIANGWEWFGRKVSRAGVLYVGAEGQAGLKKRIQATKLHYRIGETAEVPFALYPAPIDLVTDEKGTDQVIARVEAVNAVWSVRIGVVVIDTLARCFGSGDESATRDMNTFVSRCDTIRNKSGAAVLVVHHFGKDETRGMRGSIALKAAADTVIEIIGSEGVRTARVEKQKDGAAGESFAFNLKPIEIDQDEDGQPITSCVVTPADAAVAPKKTSKRGHIPAEYLTAARFLADVIVDQGEPITGNTVPANTRGVHIDRWRDRLQQKGLYEPGDKGRQWFQRARNKLIGEGYIAMEAPFVWSVRRRDEP